MLGYLSLDIICSSSLTVFLELRSRKTVRHSEQIMSTDKYPSIFSRQMEAIVYIFLNFQNCACCENDLKDNKHNNVLYLGRKYARIYVRGCYLFLAAHSFSRATLSENCSLLGTIMSADKYPSIVPRQMEAIVIYLTCLGLRCCVYSHYSRALWLREYFLSCHLSHLNFLSSSLCNGSRKYWLVICLYFTVPI